MAANRLPEKSGRDGDVLFPAELEGRLQKLSDSSTVLLGDAVELSGEIQEYYPCILKAEHTSAMTEEVRHKAEMLAHAGEALWKASSLAYDMGAEIKGRSKLCISPCLPIHICPRSTGWPPMSRS